MIISNVMKIISYYNDAIFYKTTIVYYIIKIVKFYHFEFILYIIIFSMFLVLLNSYF